MQVAVLEQSYREAIMMLGHAGQCDDSSARLELAAPVPDAGLAGLEKSPAISGRSETDNPSLPTGLRGKERVITSPSNFLNSSNSGSPLFTTGEAMPVFTSTRFTTFGDLPDFSPGVGHLDIKRSGVGLFEAGVAAFPAVAEVWHKPVTSREPS